MTSPNVSIVHGIFRPTDFYFIKGRIVVKNQKLIFLLRGFQIKNCFVHKDWIILIWNACDHLTAKVENVRSTDFLKIHS